MVATTAKSSVALGAIERPGEKLKVLVLPGIAVADIVYVPLETPLLQRARAQGLRPVEGLGMLLYQGIPGFRSWFGIEPKVDDALRRFVAADLMPR